MPNDNDKKRERIIQHILDRKIAGLGVGIFGAEVCQLCGEIGTFSGLLHAWAVHVTVPGEQGSTFVCSTCRQKAPLGADPDRDRWGKQNRWARDRLNAQSHRYCEVCRTQVERSDANRYSLKHGQVWCCPACQEAINRDGYERHSARRRYLELVLTDDDKLRAFDIVMAAERLDLEETPDPQTAAYRPQRAREALQEIERSHGRKYGSAP